MIDIGDYSEQVGKSRLTGPGRVCLGWEREEGECPAGKNVGGAFGV